MQRQHHDHLALDFVYCAYQLKQHNKLNGDCHVDLMAAHPISLLVGYVCLLAHLSIDVMPLGKVSTLWAIIFVHPILSHD